MLWILYWYLDVDREIDLDIDCRSLDEYRIKVFMRSTVAYNRCHVVSKGNSVSRKPQEL